MQVRTAVTKAGCKMADSGSVLFNFQRQGLLFVPADLSEEKACPYRCSNPTLPKSILPYPTQPYPVGHIPSRLRNTWVHSVCPWTG